LKCLPKLRVPKKLRCKLGKHNWEEGSSRQKVCKDCGKVSSPGETGFWDESTRGSDGKFHGGPEGGM